MDTKKLTSAALLYAAMGSLLAIGSALSAQITPAWTSDFSQYSNNEVLADRSTYNISTKKWRLISGNNANMPATTQAVAKTVGGLSFAQVTAAGNRDSFNARITARDFGTIVLSTTQNTYIGGDIRYNAGGVASGNGSSFIMFSGRNAANDSIQISMGINYAAATGLTFFANFNNITDSSQSMSFNAGSGFVVDPNVWYTFAAVISPDMGSTDFKILAGGEEVWGISTSNVLPVSFNAVEMQVARPGSSGLRTADFANLTVGTQIPEPATTAALILLAAFGATVLVRRRRK